MPKEEKDIDSVGKKKKRFTPISSKTARNSKTMRLNLTDGQLTRNGVFPNTDLAKDEIIWKNKCLAQSVSMKI